MWTLWFIARVVLKHVQMFIWHQRTGDRMPFEQRGQTKIARACVDYSEWQLATGHKKSG